MTITTFEVYAGKFDSTSSGSERNYKYIETFILYVDAKKAFDSCFGYPFRELSITQNEVTTIIMED